MQPILEDTSGQDATLYLLRCRGGLLFGVSKSFQNRLRSYKTHNVGGVEVLRKVQCSNIESARSMERAIKVVASNTSMLINGNEESLTDCDFSIELFDRIVRTQGSEMDGIQKPKQVEMDFCDA